ncbi:MAG: hypothetical protein IIX37_07540 [Selenomonadaceae bacterium]|nr:hypothetical protein [Selenomonadaceae bacterium]
MMIALACLPSCLRVSTSKNSSKVPMPPGHTMNAPIFPGQIRHRPDGGHHITIFPPVYVEKTKNKQEDIRRTMQQLVTSLEQQIRNYPEDWFWLHDRWKSVREIGMD